MKLTDEQRNFINVYVKALHNKTAAIFAGAGLSIGSGYVTWKDLLRDTAKEIGLDVDRESDLMGVAQYFENEKRNRGQINDLIKNQFPQHKKKNPALELIAKLPITTYWTTNYDDSLEQALQEQHRQVDIKRRDDDLHSNDYQRDAVLYKMHGDISYPEDAIITRDDYELYEFSHPLFRDILRGELASKLFLFIGFSFTDPNLNYVLGQIHSLSGKNVKNHYCLLRTVNRSDYPSDDLFTYSKNLEKLRIEDLKRYGIQTVKVDSYEQIPELLNIIMRKYLARSVFISGSVEKPPEPWSSASVDLFLKILAKKLVENKYRIITGFGVGVGSSIIQGSLNEIYKNRETHIEDSLVMFPFPQIYADSNKDELYERYRHNIIEHSGICIFLFGNKYDKGKLVDADGVYKEFQEAQSLERFIIPVASTGAQAARIAKEIETSSVYAYLDSSKLLLKNCTKPEELASEIVKIVDRIQANTEI